MVEVQGRGMLGKSADRARSAGFGDQLALDLTPALRHSNGVASGAPIAALRTEKKAV
jgi:hypothetical protein